MVFELSKDKKGFVSGFREERVKHTETARFFNPTSLSLSARPFSWLLCLTRVDGSGGVARLTRVDGSPDSGGRIGGVATASAGDLVGQVVSA